jgi:hypothetical protein
MPPAWGQPPAPGEQKHTSGDQSGLVAQVKDFALRVKDLEVELDRLKRAQLRVDSFDITIAHKSNVRPGSDDIPLDDAATLHFPQPPARGKTYGEVVACWWTHSGHYSNTQIFQRIGVLTVEPAGHRVKFYGAAMATLGPTTIRVFVVYKE